MNILITGAKGFVGRNLVENLKAIRDGKNRTRPNIQIDELYEYDLDTPREILEAGCREADFVKSRAQSGREATMSGITIVWGKQKIALS